MEVIENTHRRVDEYFLMLYAERCRRKKEFLDKAQRRQDTRVKEKANNGEEMKGMTTYGKFRESKIMAS